MLLSREHIISSVRFLQPTYSSLNALIEYIMLFPDSFSVIIDIILKESHCSNPYTNLFILYLLNELHNKQIKQEESAGGNKQHIEIIRAAMKDILERGKSKIEEIAANSTPGFKKSAKELAQKYHEIEKLVYKKDTPAEEASPVEESKETSKEKGSPESRLDIEYLENLCKKKDKGRILEYIKDLKKLV